MLDVPPAGVAVNALVPFSQTGSQEGVINAPSPDSTLKVTSAVVAGQSAVAGMLYLTVTAVSEVTSAGV